MLVGGCTLTNGGPLKHDGILTVSSYKSYNVFDSDFKKRF